MLCPEDRQRQGEEEIAEGDDLIEAASLGDVVSRSQRPDHQDHNAGSVRGDYRAGDFEE